MTHTYSPEQCAMTDTIVLKLVRVLMSLLTGCGDEYNPNFDALPLMGFDP